MAISQHGRGKHNALTADCGVGRLSLAPFPIHEGGRRFWVCYNFVFTGSPSPAPARGAGAIERERIALSAGPVTFHQTICSGGAAVALRDDSLTYVSTVLMCLLPRYSCERHCVCSNEQVRLVNLRQLYGRRRNVGLLSFLLSCT